MAEAHPRHGNQVRVVATEPGVKVVVGGPRLAGEVVALEAARTGGGAARDHVLQHGIDQPGIAWIEHARCALARDHGIGACDQLAVAVVDFLHHVRVDAKAAVGKHRVASREFPGRDAAGAERHGEIGRMLGGVEAEAADIILGKLRRDVLQHADRDHILRTREPLAQGHRTAVFTVVIFWLPGLTAGDAGRKIKRLVGDDMAGAVATLERGRVDEGFEARARLALALSDVVELVAVEVEAAHQRANRAVARVDGHQGGLHLGHLCDLPALVAVVADAHDGAAADAARLRRLVGQHRRGKAQAVGADGDFLAAAVYLDLLGRGLQHHRGEEIIVVAVLGEHFVELLVRGAVRCQAGEGLGATVAMAPVIVRHSLAQCGVGSLLVLARDGGEDAYAQLVGLLAELLDRDLARHFGDVLAVNVVRVLFARHSGVALTAGRRGHRNRGLEVGLLDEAGFEHAAQHILLAHGGARRIDHRVVCGRRLRQARQHRGLSQAERVQRLAVVGPCGHCKAISALAEVDLVDVELEDLVLAQFALDLECKQDLVELAVIGLLAREEEVACNLHGDRRCALAAPARGQVGEGSAGDAQRINPGMLVEALVLRGEDGVLER